MDICVFYVTHQLPSLLLFFQDILKYKLHNIKFLTRMLQVVLTRGMATLPGMYLVDMHVLHLASQKRRDLAECINFADSVWAMLFLVGLLLYDIK